jgi:uncharacterized flavoprotein (TIGR03862 family)
MVNHRLLQDISLDHMKNIAIIGAGPAGLMAAETLANDKVEVHIYDAMPSAGRKFLVAGKGGLNLTHAEPYESFITRYSNIEKLRPHLDAFTPDALRAWSKELGFETFVGSSGKVFPEGMQAAPVLRAWRERLSAQSVSFHFRHRWLGWGENQALRFETAEGELLTEADGVVLALGGGSWQKTGSTGAWVNILQGLGIQIQPLKPTNCGFNIQWSEHFKSRFAGEPIKSVALSFQGRTEPGEFIATEHGIEGSLIYKFSAALRDEIEESGSATIMLDLLPDSDKPTFKRPQGKKSFSSYLKKETGLSGAKANLLREVLPSESLADLGLVAATLKSLPLRLLSPRPIDEAISSAGGVSFDALDETLMLKSLPGVFCAGEMLDWEAPTGGYLLTASFATGKAAGAGLAQWLKEIP